ncbi:MAG: hypothetical protein JWR02_2752 [Mucilaginibacter sp.]|nr:hypothetical protein [Mucilaginibacter sp.]
MKKMFTKFFSAAMIIVLAITSFAVKAQTASLTNTTATSFAATTGATANSKATVHPETTTTDPKTEIKTAAKAADPDTTWKPQRRLWGYTFGDFYYEGHADPTNRGPESMYNGVPQYRNAFQFRRLYLGYDYEIDKKFKVEVLLASEPNASTGVNGTTSIQNGDNLVDGKMAFWIKNFNLRVRDLWTGTDFVIGEMSTPGFALNEPGTNAPVSLSEATWGYRSIEKTITDFHKNNSYDIGAALQGTFDPATKNYGYVLMVGNNSQASLLSAANANTGFYKIFYGDLWGKFLNKKLYVDFYADYAKTAAATAVIPGQEHNMFKIFASYSTKPITIGVEAYTQNIASGVTNSATKLPEDATVKGISLWAKGPLAKNWNYYARYDSYNPNSDFNSADSYSINTNYGSYNPTSKEQFYTAGLDYNPVKNVHFMPNIWAIYYQDNRSASTAGYLTNNHTLVYRLTFYFTFGK